MGAVFRSQGGARRAGALVKDVGGFAPDIFDKVYGPYMEPPDLGQTVPKRPGSGV